MPTNFHQKLIDLLKEDDRLRDEDGELITAAVHSHARQLDHDLVRLLLSDVEIKAKFFEEIDGHWIFNAHAFTHYLSSKNFLANSYTRFRNKIGLNIGEKFLRERGEVSLVWPYKDCVLEGGQTREEEKRKEIFFNEILAQDEINRLFDPKVLTNWKRYTVDGEAKPTEIKRDENGVIRENLIIKGNNLVALHTLKGQFRGKIKLIYIDPPYNTGSDSFGYNDNFNHSSWLTFMKNRLEVARELLRDDGSIWINIDDDEAHYLKVLCDDIFGRENFVANVVWQKKYTIANDAKYFSDNHDHILLFAKNKQRLQIKGIGRTEEQDSRYSNPNNDINGPWMTQPLHAKSGNQANFSYRFKNGVTWTPPRGTFPRYSKESLERFEIEGRLWFGKHGNAVPRVKKYLKDMKDVRPATLWLHKEVGNNDEANREIRLLIADYNFSTPKPERLLKRVVHIGSNEGDIVLDFFAGSGTTAAVCLKVHRQWITVEQMNYAINVPVERLKKVIAGERGGISASVNWQGGSDFIYCELMQYNEAYMDKIQAAQSSEELVALWENIAVNSFLNYYVNPETPADAVEVFRAIGETENGLHKQKKLLAELLDKNQLYVHLAEIDDEDFDVDENDKTLNWSFYGD